MRLDDIQINKAERKGRNPLAGAIDVAIAKAERFHTPLVIKDDKGRIREVTPAQMKRLVREK